MKSIHIVENTLPVAWEKAVLACWEEGENFPTEYDKESDPNSRDVTALIHVKNPMAEPRIHRAFPGGLHDLEKYRSEVMYGVHNHWIDPKAGKWEYTYHERLFEYSLPHENITIYDQIQKCIEMIKACSFTRRAQAVTWKVWEDLGISDPTCLQRIWVRCQDGKMNMNIHMRSNCAFKASFMNMYAFTELQAYMAAEAGYEVGEYMHIADSFHIYGSYFEDFQGFLNIIDKREPEDRVFTTEEANFFFIDGCNELLAEEDMPENKKEKVRERKSYLEAQL
jgi:thymidylate synthase